MTNLTDWMPVLTAILGSGVVIAIMDYIKNRKKIRTDVELAQRIQESQVAVADIGAIQARVTTLETIIDQQAKHNERLQSEIDKAEERDRKRLDRIRELENEVDRIRQQARETQATCDELSIKLRRFTREVATGEGGTSNA